MKGSEMDVLERHPCLACGGIETQVRNDGYAACDDCGYRFEAEGARLYEVLARIPDLGTIIVESLKVALVDVNQRITERPAESMYQATKLAQSDEVTVYGLDPVLEVLDPDGNEFLFSWDSTSASWSLFSIDDPVSTPVDSVDRGYAYPPD